MTGFPLLRLPLLPLKDVFNMMDPLEITLLFTCSVKIRNAIYATKKEVFYDLLSIDQKKNLNALAVLHFFRFKVQDRPFRGGKFKVANTIEFQLYLNYYGNPFPLSSFSIHVICIDQLYRYKEVGGNFDFDGITVPVIMTNKQTLYTFWNSEYEGLSVLTGYIKKVFDAHFEDYTICGSEEPISSQYLKAAVKWMGQQSRINNCYIKNLELVSDDDYKSILDNVNPRWRYYHAGQLNEKFQHATNIKSRILSLDHASWFKIDNLLNTESAFITLHKSKLTDDDMKEFLKQWVNGRFSKLEHLFVEMENQVNFSHILSVLPGYTSTQENIKREEYVLEQYDNKVRITRHDGFIATIHKEKEGFFEMTVRLK